MLKELDLEYLHKKFLIKPKGIIQVGGFLSSEYIAFQKLNINNLIFIEANPSIIDRLKNNVDADCKVLNELITDQDYKEYEFKISNHTQSSSILEFDKHKIYHPDMSTVVETIDLTSITLDTLIDRENININKYDMLMIDVQGAEMLVLKGFSKNLNNIKYVYTELNFDSMYNNCVLEPELTEYMKQNDFVLLDYFDTGKGWGDGVYVHKRELK